MVHDSGSLTPKTPREFENYAWTWAQAHGAKLDAMMEVILARVEESCLLVIDNECQRQSLADDITRVLIGGCASSVRDSLKEAEKHPYEFHGDLGFGKCPICNGPIWPDANGVKGHYVCTQTGTTVTDLSEVV